MLAFLNARVSSGAASRRGKSDAAGREANCSAISNTRRMQSF